MSSFISRAPVWASAVATAISQDAHTDSAWLQENLDVVNSSVAYKKFNVLKVVHYIEDQLK